MLLLAFLGSIRTTQADIAPSQFIGSDIVAHSATNVRMEKASVEIVWGMPPALTATFRMVNPSGRPEDIRVGFPMPMEPGTVAFPIDPESDAALSKSLASLDVTFDGARESMIRPGKNKDDEDMLHEWMWFRCRHTFKPGVTMVVVHTPLPATRFKGTVFRESLLYCIQTGGAWSGPIGEEDVSIRFPNPIDESQITAASPSGYRIEGNVVRWRFEDFKPVGKEYDIALTYIRPEVPPLLATLRRDLAQKPRSSAAAVRLAKHLLVLGDFRSNEGYPPRKLSREEHAELLGRITSSGDRAIFSRNYLQNAKGAFEEVDDDWTADGLALVQILADAGYRDRESMRPFILEGERLLRETLAREPHNAEAWNVYLANYWRFSFAAFGHFMGPCRMSRAQADLIETAARDCPRDPFIGRWLALLRGSRDWPEVTQFLKDIYRDDFMKTEYPKIDYGYY